MAKKILGGVGPGPETTGGVKQSIGIFEFTNWKWWIPSKHELAIFILAVFLTYWVVQTYQYNSVETKLIRESRCYKDKHSIKAGGTQYVTATNSQNLPLYNVGYNLSGKQVNIECACKEGDIVNTFKNIPIYDLSNNSVSKSTTKQCNCDSDLLSASPNIYYNGYPGIVKFMNTATSASSADLSNDPSIDTSFFLPVNK